VAPEEPKKHKSPRWCAVANQSSKETTLSYVRGKGYVCVCGLEFSKDELRKDSGDE